MAKKTVEQSSSKSLSHWRGRNTLKAFTLSEVLISLIIIGIIAAITVPTILYQQKWKQHKAGALKALSVLNQATNMWYKEYGAPAECGYWRKNPYLDSGCHATCQERNDKGQCIKYVCKETEKPLPSDYNGPYKDCNALYSFFQKTFNTVKVCESNAYQNGCIPKYEGKDTISKANNPNLSDYEIGQQGCGGFNQDIILSGHAFVTNDGMIFFRYNNTSTMIIAVDTNGFKGPNKWGHDIHSFDAQINEINTNPKYRAGSTCVLTEKRGKPTKDLIYSK